MKKVIITGANGFVGNTLVREFLNNNYMVTAVVRDENENIDSISLLPNVEIVYCDLSQISSLKERIDGEYDFFIHLAWAGTSGNQRADYELQLNNAKYACDAVITASELKCRRFIFAGSLMEFEAVKYAPDDNTTPGMAYIYSTAKLTANYMAKTVAINEGVEYVNLIISNIYGPGEISKRFINVTLLKFMNNERLSFTSGEQLYDFIYIDDAVKVIRLAAEKGRTLNNYYVGSGQVRPLCEFIKDIQKTIEPEREMFFGEVEFSGASLTYKEFDVNKAERELGFKPEVSFEQGIRNTYEWLKNREDL